MPSYDEIKRAVFYSAEKPELLADILVKINDLADLASAVTITGTLKFDQTLTAVTTGITNNTGTLSYQWYRDGVAIAEAVSNTYKLVVADITKHITVGVSSSIEQGEVISTATAVIAKADGATAPNVTGAVLSITGLSAAVLYEYKISTDTAYTPVTAEATSITEIVAESYDVRIAETATTLASAVKTVTVTAE